MHRMKKGSVLLLALTCLIGCSQADGQMGEQEERKEEINKATAPEGEAAGQQKDTLTVTFLDVGEGNSVLVEQNGAYMLIDGGDREYSSFVVSYLEDTGVEELEYVIASHYDADHLNGIVGALNVFSCQTVLAADYTTDTRVYESFCDVVEEKDIELVYPAMGEEYTFQDASFTIVCPDAYDYEEANDNSIGIRLVYGDTSFLICGDAGTDVEKVMLQSGLTLDSDVYLASHHGSGYSSSYEFLQTVSPSAVVISVGADNSYGHPTERVLNDIAAVGAELYRTDELGTIRVVSDGSTISFDRMPAENAGSMAASGTGMENDAVTEPENGAVTESEINAVSGEYVLNRNTKKFHLPACSSAADISEENRADFMGSREELIAAGYEACKRCNP